jgi:hypothetical protein
MAILQQQKVFRRQRGGRNDGLIGQAMARRQRRPERAYGDGQGLGLAAIPRQRGQNGQAPPG